MPGLTDLEQQILAFEKQTWRHTGAKATAIHELFGMTETRYYQQLNALLDRPAALVEQPQVINRLRRLRDQRRRRRSPGSSAS